MPSTKIWNERYGKVFYDLGVRITHGCRVRKICLDQEKHINKVLERFHIENCNVISNPVVKGVYFRKTQAHKDQKEINEASKVPYAVIVGSLMYAMTSARPDICHAIGLISPY